ncbi:MAG: hypothetical protein AAF415_12660 [Pseudomonadota bacterium]
MILKGAQRGGAKALANHLLNKEDNDFVEVCAYRDICSTRKNGDEAGRTGMEEVKTMG